MITNYGSAQCARFLFRIHPCVAAMFAVVLLSASSARAQLDRLSVWRADRSGSDQARFIPLEEGQSEDCRLVIERSTARDLLRVHAPMDGPAVYGISGSSELDTRRFQLLPLILSSCEIGIVAFQGRGAREAAALSFWEQSREVLPLVAASRSASLESATWARVMDGCVDGRTPRCIVYGNWRQVEAAIDPRNFRIVDRTISVTELGAPLRSLPLPYGAPMLGTVYVDPHSLGARVTHVELVARDGTRVDAIAVPTEATFQGDTPGDQGYVVHYAREGGFAIVVSNEDGVARASLHDRNGVRIDAVASSIEPFRRSQRMHPRTVAVVDGARLRVALDWGGDEALLFDRNGRATWARVLGSQPESGEHHMVLYFVARRCGQRTCLAAARQRPPDFW
jgi:hypothetical protein